jgi:hypothetical protein
MARYRYVSLSTCIATTALVCTAAYSQDTPALGMQTSPVIVQATALMENSLQMPFGTLFIKKVEYETYFKVNGYHRNSRVVTESSLIDPGRSKVTVITADKCVYNIVARVSGTDSKGNQIRLVGSYAFPISRPTTTSLGPLGDGCLTRISFKTETMVVARN